MKLIRNFTPMNEAWWLYCIECKGGGIYVGITKDVSLRFKQHKNGRGALYTKLNPPVSLLCKRAFPSRKEAHQVELKLKKMNRNVKCKFIRQIILEENYSSDRIS